jgi:hypothetical protein
MLKTIVLPHKVTYRAYRAYRALRAYSRAGRASRGRTFLKMSILAFQCALNDIKGGSTIFTLFSVKKQQLTQLKQATK